MLRSFSNPGQSHGKTCLKTDSRTSPVLALSLLSATGTLASQCSLLLRLCLTLSSSFSGIFWVPILMNLLNQGRIWSKKRSLRIRNARDIIIQRQWRSQGIFSDRGPNVSINSIQSHDFSNPQTAFCYNCNPSVPTMDEKGRSRDPIKQTNLTMSNSSHLFLKITNCWLQLKWKYMFVF